NLLAILAAEPAHALLGVPDTWPVSDRPCAPDDSCVGIEFPMGRSDDHASRGVPDSPGMVWVVAVLDRGLLPGWLPGDFTVRPGEPDRQGSRGARQGLRPGRDQRVADGHPGVGDVVVHFGGFATATAGGAESVLDLVGRAPGVRLARLGP